MKDARASSLAVAWANVRMSDSLDLTLDTTPDAADERAAEAAHDINIVDAFFAAESKASHDQPLAAEAAEEAIAHAAMRDPSEGSADAAVAEDAAAVDTGPNLFEALGLATPLVMAVRDLGFTQPTAVQEKTIPLAMKSQADGAKYNDLMVSSQTGSGKTAAYLLPVLHTLFVDIQERIQAEKDEKARLIAEGQEVPKGPKRRDPTNPRHFKAATPGALILCPTRELAQQVSNDAIDLARHMQGVRVATVIGGLPYQQQIARLQNATLVVATPGRLLDLQRSHQIKCESVKFLVVDEADRMLDLGFADALAEINQLTIERQQTMMFSATFEARIQGLAKRVMREPQRVTIDTPQERHVNIQQSLYWADNATHKRKLLDQLMRDTSIAQAIVFASTQIECDGLANDLVQAGFSAAALHGALSQFVRNRRLNNLRDGHIQFLVATDVAARGLDVPNISHVFNYGLPMKSEDYVHRIGRTGRAGRNGVAATIAEHRDFRKIGDIEHYTKQRLQAQTLPGLEPTAPKRAAPTRKMRENDRAKKRSDYHGGGDRAPAFNAERAPTWNADRAPQRDFAPQREFAPKRDVAAQAPRDYVRAAPQNHDPRFAPRNDDQPRFQPRGFDPRFPDRSQEPRFQDRGGDSRGAPRDADSRGAPRGYGQQRPPAGGDARGFDPRGPARGYGQPDQRGGAPRFDQRGPATQRFDAPRGHGQGFEGRGGPAPRFEQRGGAPFGDARGPAPRTGYAKQRPAHGGPATPFEGRRPAGKPSRG
jgi:superfamily II DNA/RNA helicase